MRHEGHPASPQAPQTVSALQAPTGRTAVRRYGVALASIAAWFATTVATSDAAHNNGLLMALAAVTISAWYGGVGPGLLATLLTLLSVDYVMPLVLAADAGAPDGLRPSLFASVGILISALSEAKRHAENDLERSLQTLERRVRERTEELTAANTALSSQIVERRKAEEAYRELFENAGDMVFTLSPEGTITSINKVGERLTGRPRTDLLKLRFEELVAPRERAGLVEVMATLRQDGSPPPLMLEIRRPDGERTRVEASLRLILRAGAAVGIHGVARDLTERERLETELRQAQKLEAIGHLAGGVAHDFNNILMVIQGYSEMLLSQVDGEADRDDLAQILEAARRGGDLTRQLLAFGRKQVLQVQPLDLNAVVLDTSQMLERLIGENITLRIEPAPVMCAIEADRSQLEQVLVNLAVNARDAMTRGGLLTVSVDRVEVTGAGHAIPEGAYVKLEVRDNGSGMDQVTMQRVFEPFFTTKAPGKGSGLGLSTVYGVVKQLGGDVTVESTPLQGSTFTVLLPVTSKLPEAAHETMIPELASGGGETVLLVEDDAPVRALLRSVLQRHGYQVLVAHGPREALSIAARHTGRLDLVLSDVIMPEMSGPEMVALLKNIRPEPAVLYLSGYATDALVTDRVLPGAVTLVQKPVSARQLLQSVRMVLTSSDAPALRAAG